MSIQSKAPPRSEVIEVQSNFKAGIVSLDTLGQDQFNKEFTYLTESLNVVGSKGGSLVSRQGFRLVLSTDLKNPDVFYLSDAGEIWVMFWTSVPTPKIILVPNPDEDNPKHLEFNFTFHDTFILNDQVKVSSSTKGSLTLVSNDLVRFKIKNETEVEVENLTKLNTTLPAPNLIINADSIELGTGATCDIEFIDPLGFAHIKVGDIAGKPYEIQNNSGTVLKNNNFNTNLLDSDVGIQRFNYISQATGMLYYDKYIDIQTVAYISQIAFAGMNLTGKFKIKNFIGLIYDNVEKKHKKLTTGEIVFSGSYISINDKFKISDIVMKLPAGVTLNDALNDGRGRLTEYYVRNADFGAYHVKFSQYVGNDTNLHLQLKNDVKLSIATTRIDTSALTNDTQTNIFHLTTAMLIHNQRAYVVLDDKIIYSKVGKYNDFGTYTLPNFAQEVLLDGVSRCNAIIPFKDGIVFSRADGIRFFRLDTQPISGVVTEVPYLSKELDVTAIDDGLIEISGKLLIVTKTSILMAIIATRGDLFFSGDQLPTFLGTVDLSQKASHIFAEGIEFVRPIRRSTPIGTKGILIKTLKNNMYIFSVNATGETNTPDTSFFQMSFGRNVKISDGNGDLILSDSLKTNVGIAEYPIGFNKDNFIDFAIFNKNIKSKFLDFFVSKQVETILIGTLSKKDPELNGVIFNVDQTRSLGGIPSDFSDKLYVLKNPINVKKYIVKIITILENTTIYLNFITETCCYSDIGNNQTWMLIGEYKEIEQDVLTSYKEKFSTFDVLIFDGKEHQLVNSVEFDPTVKCVSYALGTRYNQRFATFIDALPYEVNKKRMRIFGFGFEKLCFTFKKQLGFKEEFQPCNLQSEQTCMYTDVVLMETFATTHSPNVETMSFNFKQGLFTGISKIVYHYEVIR